MLSTLARHAIGMTGKIMMMIIIISLEMFINYEGEDDFTILIFIILEKE